MSIIVNLIIILIHSFSIMDCICHYFKTKKQIENIEKMRKSLIDTLRKDEEELANIKKRIVERKKRILVLNLELRMRGCDASWSLAELDVSFNPNGGKSTTLKD